MCPKKFTNQVFFILYLIFAARFARMSFLGLRTYAARQLACGIRICGSQFLSRHVHESGVRIVDMRSDVLTKPTPVILQAMTQASLDDDVFQEDRTANCEFSILLAVYLGHLDTSGLT
jgi:hypothetical protein